MAWSFHLVHTNSFSSTQPTAQRSQSSGTAEQEAAIAALTAQVHRLAQWEGELHQSTAAATTTTAGAEEWRTENKFHRVANFGEKKDHVQGEERVYAVDELPTRRRDQGRISELCQRRNRVVTKKAAASRTRLRDEKYPSVWTTEST